MNDLLAARLTMGFSLGFHIIFAAIGMVMPFFMAIAHFLYLKKHRKEDLELTRLWLKGVAIFFAVGAVSGTVLSFELGLLWPGFMRLAGPIIGMPFSWEGTAFFLEAVAIGLFLYGWDRVHPWLHWTAGLVVGISGFASGIFVVAANSWMNTPTGFQWAQGKATQIDPVAAFFNPAWFHQSLHMQVAAIQAVGFAVAGVHAFLLLKNKGSVLHRRALQIALSFAAIASLIQPLVGHFAAQKVAELEPVKLAAMEGHFKTERRAPLYIGGIPDVNAREMRGGIPIPGALSFLAFNDLNAEVRGLEAFPHENWPPVKTTHLSFQGMVAIGTYLALLGVLALVILRQRKMPDRFLKLLVATTPLGFVALELGWITTEVGRQPWIISGVLRTQEALTPVPGMQFHFAFFTALYVFLFGATAWLFRRQIQVAHRRLAFPATEKPRG